MNSSSANASAELLQRGYTLLGKIHKSESAVVYDAEHGATKRRVAIKLTLLSAPDAQRNAGRLLTAWNVGRGLRHPHIVNALDGGRLSDGRAWLVMERLRGRDLGLELHEVGRLAPARAVHIVRQVCDALQVLHRRGAVHRAIEPHNIFLCSAGHFADHIKLIDLGLLSVGEDDPHRMHSPTGPISLGTPLYRAPEIARGERAGPAADLYSVGAVLYHLLAGEPPFQHDNPLLLIAMHAKEPVPLLPADLALPRELVQLVYRLLDKEPAARPSDAGGVMRALDHCLAQIPGRAPVDTGHDPALPRVPPAGVTSEWHRFADALRRAVRLGWPQLREAPQPLTDALAWVTGARSALDEKASHAERERQMADERARRRIEDRTRFEQRIEALDGALEEARSSRRIAEHRVYGGVRAREGVDQQYRKVLRTLEIAVSGGPGPISSRDVNPHIGSLRDLLARRNNIEVKVRAARDAERTTAEQVALLLAERLEVQRTLADIELEEQDEGTRAEMLADRSADEVLAAQRAYENACVHLYQRCIELIFEAGR
ncbi:MAG: protein kinase [Myxococcales bacterium]|nr:protein kinase [Myxococcales bacterium]